jgi:hypothetical protein
MPNNTIKTNVVMFAEFTTNAPVTGVSRLSELHRATVHIYLVSQAIV